MLQLVSDNVTVNVTKKGISDVEAYTPQYLFEKMEITPEQIIELKSLMGDSSDNIPGVPGVGEKTATKLLKQYQTLDNLYEHLDEVSGKKLKENLTNHKEDAFMSRELATINCDSPIEVSINDLSYEGYPNQDVANLFKDLGFQSLLDRVGSEDIVEETEEELEELNYTIVKEITSDMFTGEEALVIEMLSDSYHTAPIEGIGITNREKAYFIPTNVALESEEFKKWAENPANKKVVFDAKQSVVSLLKKGIHLKGVRFDVLLASYLLNPAENNHDIPAIAHRWGFKSVRFDEEVYGKGAKMKIPEQETPQNILHVKPMCS